MLYTLYSPRRSRHMRRYYYDTDSDDGPPIWALCFLALSSMVALSYAVVLLGNSWRGDREAAVAAYSASLRNWTIYRDQLLRTNFSAHANWGASLMKRGVQIELQKDDSQSDATTTTAHDTEVASDLPDIVYLSYKRNPVPPGFLPTLDFASIQNETATFTFVASSSSSSPTSGESGRNIVGSTMVTMPIPLWNKRTVPGATPVPERKCPEQQRGVYVGAGKCEIYTRLTSICVRARLLDVAQEPEDGGGASKSKATAPAASALSEERAGKESRDADGGMAETSRWRVLLRGGMRRLVAGSSDGDRETEPGVSQGNTLQWVLAPKKEGDLSSVGCTKNTALGLKSNSVHWGAASYAVVRPTLTHDKAGRRVYHFPETTLNDVKLTLRSDHDPVVELAKATRGKLDFGLSASHALFLGLFLCCTGLLLAVPPGCAAYRCYRVEKSRSYHERRSVGTPGAANRPSRGARQTYARVRAETDEYYDDSDSDDDDDDDRDYAKSADRSASFPSQLGEEKRSVSDFVESDHPRNNNEGSSGLSTRDIELISRNKQARR